jgi:hypothetical protein
MQIVGASSLAIPSSDHLQAGASTDHQTVSLTASENGVHRIDTAKFDFNRRVNERRFEMAFMREWSWPATTRKVAQRINKISVSIVAYDQLSGSEAHPPPRPTGRCNPAKHRQRDMRGRWPAPVLLSHFGWSNHGTEYCLSTCLGRGAIALTRGKIPRRANRAKFALARAGNAKPFPDHSESVANGEAGSPAWLKRLPSGTSAQP